MFYCMNRYFVELIEACIAVCRWSYRAIACLSRERGERQKMEAVPLENLLGARSDYQVVKLMTEGEDSLSRRAVHSYRRFI